MIKNPAAYVKAYAAWIGGVLSATILAAPAIGIDIPPYLALVSIVITAISVQALPNAAVTTGDHAA
ncbi:hypothetical protein D6T64_12170 [Cryobacterium melibiosiphilum]|uniref:Uncharacterized protein n=1 Tax=Cryobacterium melibiosiphilum TaxID=995039 RepID=A0A3A5MG95_9MICO|nr:hypothetical protein [Cryobacterium melibiosiphilum]RJT88135.1 hypothetical protein D6T64_12170 [Cryobacterium melibiosiphilum]